MIQTDLSMTHCGLEGRGLQAFWDAMFVLVGLSSFFCLYHHKQASKMQSIITEVEWAYRFQGLCPGLFIDEIH